MTPSRIVMRVGVRMKPARRRLNATSAPASRVTVGRELPSTPCIGCGRCAKLLAQHAAQGRLAADAELVHGDLAGYALALDDRVDREIAAETARR